MKNKQYSMNSRQNNRQIDLKRNLGLLIQNHRTSSSALASKLKVNKSTFHNYCQGVLPKGVRSLIKIANYFNISVDDLLFSENIRNTKNTEDSENLNWPCEGVFKVTVEKIKKEY